MDNKSDQHFDFKKLEIMKKLSEDLKQKNEYLKKEKEKLAGMELELIKYFKSSGRTWIDETGNRKSFIAITKHKKEGTWNAARLQEFWEMFLAKLKNNSKLPTITECCLEMKNYLKGHEKRELKLIRLKTLPLVPKTMKYYEEWIAGNIDDDDDDDVSKANNNHMFSSSSSSSSNNPNAFIFSKPS